MDQASIVPRLMHLFRIPMSQCTSETTLSSWNSRILVVLSQVAFVVARVTHLNQLNTIISPGNQTCGSVDKRTYCAWMDWFGLTRTWTLVHLTHFTLAREERRALRVCFSIARSFLSAFHGCAKPKSNLEKTDRLSKSSLKSPESQKL